MSESIGINLPTPASPIADPSSGVVTTAWWYFFNRLTTRTGGAQGVNSSDVEASATAAQTAATSAQSSAAAAQTAATTAQATANAAVPLAGGTMTGPLILNGAPAVPLQAATKAYVDASSGNAPVQSVAGRIGNVVLSYTDIGGLATVAHTGAYTDLTGTPVTVSPGTALPLIDGTATPGLSLLYSRQDHVHPTDTTRYAASNPSGYQTASQVSTAVGVETTRAEAAEALLAPRASPVFTTGAGFFGHTVPGTQPAAPVTLADVIAILTGCGLCA